MMDHVGLNQTASEISSMTTTNMELMYIVLVVTIVDPRHFRRELTQDACAGTLVHKDLVITSASCLIHRYQEHPNPDDTKVLIGNNNYKMYAELKAHQIYIHPGFSSNDEDYNIAAIKVEEQTRVTDFPKLPSQPLDFKRHMLKCKLAGYGKLTSIKISNFKVIQLSPSIVEEIDCRIKSDNRICLHFENLLPCNGDVGSPIICDGEFYAIFSPNTIIYPKLCMERYGTIFVKVHSVRKWIQGIIDVPPVKLQWLNSSWSVMIFCCGGLAVLGSVYYIIMKYLQKREEPLATDTMSEGEGDDDLNTLNSEWTRT